MKLGAVTFLFCVLSYLLGAVPFGFLLGKARGIDVRRVGSGNTGATNVFRTVGKVWGIVTFFLDVLKGFVPAFVFPILIRDLVQMAVCPMYGVGILCGVYAIVGHNWPVYLKFRGGKGVATSAGVLLGVSPLVVILAAFVWGGVFLCSRYVSVASMSVALFVPVCGWILHVEDNYCLRPLVLTALGAVVIIRHKSNIARLRNGTESRFVFGKREKNLQG